MTKAQTALCLLPLLLPVLAGPVQAQGSADAEDNSAMPRCGPPTDGQILCKFGSVYECQYINPNSMERRTGWRWKSDSLQSCDEARPATAEPPQGLPQGFVYAPQANTQSSQLASPDNQAVPPTQAGRQPGGALYYDPNAALPASRASRHY
jgi:hypothetical protein